MLSSELKYELKTTHLSLQIPDPSPNMKIREEYE